MSAINAELFGAFSIQIGDTTHTKLRTAKVQALLAYLIIEHAQPVQRETLYELLWPGLPQQSAQVNLRQTLYQARKLLRQAAPRPIVGSRGHLRLNSDIDLWADAIAFDRLLTTNATHEHTDIRSCESCQERLKQAIDLYKGPLLADLYLSDSNVFEEWAAERRSVYQRRYFDALSSLTTVYLSNGRYAEAEAMARRQLDHDPLRETAYQQLMHALARNGHHDAALSIYDTCRVRLREELGMAPTERTSALAQRIAAGKADLATVQTPDVRGYELLEEIGNGAFGVVHRAYQPLIDRDVAIKIIKPEYANRPDFIRRFEVEAQTIARLEHAHIVPLYDYWREPGGAFLVMRYMRGGNLQQALQARGAWRPAQVLRLVEQLTAALAVAHAEGVVHRDLKPTNILLDEDDNAYLSDFGIARDLGGHDGNIDGAMLTASPHYTSPEQLRGHPVTTRSDIYTFGLLLFELLTGHKPFGDRSIGQMVPKHLSESLPSVQTLNSSLPSALDNVLRRATAVDPTQRYSDVHEFAARVRDALAGVAADSLPAPLAQQIDGNPYKGLHAFQESDAATFFGRDALIEQLVDHLRDSRFLAVVGPSGSGKSSVVKAGLLPRIRAGAIAGSDAWFISQMTPGRRPLEELELALLRVAVEPPASLLEPLERDERGLTRVLKRILPAGDDGTPGELLLLIDQFEELFTLSDEQRRKHFLANLLTALNESRSRLRVIVTLRADFYDRPLQLPELAELIQQHNVVVTPLTAVELEAAIVQPARLAGARFAAGLVTQIVDDVRDQPGILPLLQYALTELYERREGNELTHAAYRELGGVQGVLGKRAEEIYAELTAEEQSLTRQIFLRLVTLGEGVEDTRRRVLRSELVALGEQSSQKVLTHFGNARLLSFDRDPLTRNPTVEVAHEALLREWPRLQEWLRSSRDDVRMQRLLAAAASDWQASGHDDSYLLRGSRLDQFANWHTDSDLALTGLEQELLAASVSARSERRAAAEARRQQELQMARDLAAAERQRAEEQAAAAANLRRRALLLAGALVIAAFLAVAAVFFGRQATTNAGLAATRAAEAQHNADMAATSDAESRMQAQLAFDNANLAATGEAEAAAQALLAARNADLAATREAQAVQAGQLAEEQRAEAEAQGRLAFARELAASAIASLDEDSERSILLALRSLSIDYTDVGEDVLRRAVRSSRIRTFVPRTLAETATNYQVYFNADGTQLIEVSGDENNSHIIYYDAASGEQLQRIACGTDCWEGALSPDGRWLSAKVDQHFVLIDVERSRATGTAQRHALLPNPDEGRRGFSTFSPDSTRLATASFNKQLHVWDVPSGERLFTIEEPLVSWVFIQPTFSPDGALLATSDVRLNTPIGARIFDATSGELLIEFPQEQVWPIFSADGKRLITQTHDNVFHVWDVDESLATGEPREMYSFDAGPESTRIQQLAVSPDGQYMADPNDRSVWRLEEDGATLALQLKSEMVVTHGFRFSNDSRLLVGWGGGGIAVWDISRSGERELMAIDAHQSAVQQIRFDASGELLASAAGDGAAAVWDAQSGELLQRFEGHTGPVRDVAFSPDGSLLVTAGDDRTARIWEIDGGEQRAALDASDEGDVGAFFVGVMTARFSPDGREIVTGAVDGTVRFWDATTYEELERILINPRPAGEFRAAWGVATAAYSPDGRYVAAVTDGNLEDGLLRVWERASGEIVLEQRIGTRVFSVSFSPDSRRAVIATGHAGDFERIQVWDIESGEKLLGIDMPALSIRNAYFSSDGNRLLAQSEQAVTIWDAWTGERLQNFPYGRHYQLSHDESRLYVGADNGLIHVYLTDVDELIALAESRLTRSLTEEECRRYLHVDGCNEAVAGR